MRLPEPLPEKRGAPLRQPRSLRHLSQDRGKPRSVPQFPSGEGGWGNLQQRARSSQSSSGEPPRLVRPQPRPSSPGSGRGVNSGLGAAAGPRWFPACCRDSCGSSAGAKPVLGCVCGGSQAPHQNRRCTAVPARLTFPSHAQTKAPALWQRLLAGERWGCTPRHNRPPVNPAERCWWAGGQALGANVTSTKRRGGNRPCEMADDEHPRNISALSQRAARANHILCLPSLL